MPPRWATPKGHKTLSIYTEPDQMMISYINPTFYARGALNHELNVVVTALFGVDVGRLGRVEYQRSTPRSLPTPC
jgi:hypothetical protein